MLIKKKLAVALILTTASFVAHADLKVTNDTPQDSTVKVKHNGICAGAYGHFTPKGETKEFLWGQVAGMCTGAFPVCNAEIYMSRDCSGPVHTTASLNLQTKVVTINEENPAGSPYKFTKLAPSHMKISPK